MKKLKWIVIPIITLLLGGVLGYYINYSQNKLESLPLPEVTGGERGMLGIDKNINEETIDNYLGRSDSVYRDMRMLKDPENHHKLEIDPEAAKIVKKIFEQALCGKSKQQIAEELNYKNILSPSLYLKKKNNLRTNLENAKWNEKSIDHILKNRVYIGTLVQGKRRRISHKTHNFLRIAEEDWIISEHKHEPIIKEEIFKQVNNILYGRNIKVNKKNELSSYSGYLKCSECGSNLCRMNRKRGNIKEYYYYCNTYLRTKECNKHYILERELNDIVIESLNHYIKLVCDVISKLKNTFTSNLEYNKEISLMKIVEIDKEIDKYNTLLDEVKKDYTNSIISKEDYEDFYMSYVYELNNLKLEKEEIETSNLNSNKIKWIKHFKKTNKISEINRSIISAFVDNIYVNNDRTIEIHFRFKEQYEETLMFFNK